MVFARVLVVLLGLLWAGVSLAVDLNLSAETSVEYDNNVFRTDSDKDDDVSFRIGPIIDFSDEERKFSYNLRYSPVYEKFIKYDENDDLSHFVNGTGTYAFSDRTSVEVAERFSKTQSLNQGAFNNDEQTGQDPDAEQGRDDIYINTASISLRHNFSPRTVGQLALSSDYYDSDRKDTSRALSGQGITSLTYALNARNRIGGGGGASYQNFKKSRFNPGSETWTYRVFGSWLATIGESTEFSVRLGPAFIQNKQKLNETERVVDTSPFAAVGGAAAQSLGAAYTSITQVGGASVNGLDLPSQVYEMTAPGVFQAYPVMAGQLVNPGSFLVPFSNLNNQIVGAPACGGAVDGQLVFNAANCPFSVVVDPVQNPAVAGVAAAIANGVNGTSTMLRADSDDDDTRIAIFGEMSLSHRWLPNLSSAVSYSRSDSGVSSLSSTTISDRVTVSTNWNPTTRWNVNVRGDWVKRESATDSSLTFQAITVDNAGLIQNSAFIVTDKQNEAVDTTYWSVSGRASYRITKRGTVTLRLTYQNQDTNQGARSANSTFQDVVGFIGFRYDLDPFRF